MPRRTSLASNRANPDEARILTHPLRQHLERQVGLVVGGDEMLRVCDRTLGELYRLKDSMEEIALLIPSNDAHSAQ